jgi:L-threonylcarbamoyladenylate synthase
MFEFNTIWAYPTDTSFGLGVRCDDKKGLQKLMELKKRAPQKFFSLMVKDLKMLQQYAHVPKEITQEWFFETPKTIILTPKSTLPKSQFWPEAKVAFRICTIPDIAKHIQIPVTATSANLSGTTPLFNIDSIKSQWGSNISIYQKIKMLQKNEPSNIFDATQNPWIQIR